MVIYYDIQKKGMISWKDFVSCLASIKDIRLYKK